MNYFLIMNPKSRHESGRKYFRTILEEFGKRPGRTDYVFGTSYENIRAHSEFANCQGYDAIIAVGGDGTINATINGFYDPNGRRLSKAMFGVIYTGTSPDFCKSYGIPLNIKDALHTAIDPGLRRIRLGKIIFHKTDNPEMTETRVFACCANIGLGAGVARTSNKIRKYAGDFGGTLISVLWNLAVKRFGEMQVTTDGTTFTLKKFRNISIGRTKYIASGIRVTDGMNDTDERFYVLTAKNISMPVLTKLLYEIYNGKFNSPEILELSYARELGFHSMDKSVGVEFDGDPAGTLPCSITPAADLLDLMVARTENQ